jgi:hypothetical protein
MIFLVLLLLVLVLYLLYKVKQIIDWLQILLAALIAQFNKCGCPQDPGWPPNQPPPSWP